MPKPTRSCIHLAAAIKVYLRAHPGAADSDQGMVDWWLPDMGLQASVAEVRAALELLERKGIVERQVLVDGQSLYRAGRQVRGVSH